jgi:hypothetical protein
MPGMLTAWGVRVIRVDADNYVVGFHTRLAFAKFVEDDDLPDLTDPATLGCLLALVREAWGDPSVGIFRSALGQEWCVLIQKGGLQGFHAPTEAAALVAALEAAP